MTQPPTENLLHADLTDRVLKVFFSVFNELGPWFPEFVYRRALVIALADVSIQAVEHMAVPVWFRGSRIASFQVDVVIPSGPVIVEVKATAHIEPFHVTQTLGYLKATDAEVALILNFAKHPQFRRLVLENRRKRVAEGGSPLVEC